jgi:hypothetical protein
VRERVRVRVPVARRDNPLTSILSPGIWGEEEVSEL